MLKDHKILVRSLDDQQEERLTCLDISTFSYDFKVNESWQISFTAVLNTDTENSFNMLDNEAKIIYDDEVFDIKVCDSSYSGGIISKNVTATHHIYNIQHFKQYSINAGSKKYSLKEMLDFVFSDSRNTEFSFDIFGSSFTSIEITDWGNCTGLDAVQKAVDSYGAYWIPEGNVIHFFDEDSYKNMTNKQIIWSHNTDDIQLSKDSTSMINAGMLYGATVEEDHTGTSDTGTPTQGKFDESATTSTGNAIGTINTNQAIPNDEEGRWGAPIYNQPNGNIISYALNGTDWKIDRQISIDDVVWYEIGINCWVKADYFVFDKEGNVSPENHVIEQVLGQGTIKAHDEGGQDESGNEIPARTNADLYDSPWTPQSKIRTLDNGTQWKINGAVSDGAQAKSWYRVATNEWVAQEDFDFSGKTDVQPKNQETDVDEDTTSDDETKYQFEPFFYFNRESVETYGWKIGEDITNDQITTVQAMKTYADSVFEVEPIPVLTVTTFDRDEYKLGDVIFLNADPIGLQTHLTVDGVSGNPLLEDSSYTYTFSNSKQTQSNIINDLSNQINRTKRDNYLLRKAIRKLQANK